MNNSAIKKSLLYTVLTAILLLPGLAIAGGHAASTPGVNGYDLVSYHMGKKPLVGNGNHAYEYKGVTYIFINEDNKKTFAANSEKYLPAYGGWCAYGVAFGKKFVADPDVWKLVDEKLYLNLDTGIQAKWQEDMSGKITMADQQWSKIRDRAPSEL